MGVAEAEAGARAGDSRIKMTAARRLAGFSRRRQIDRPFTAGSSPRAKTCPRPIATVSFSDRTRAAIAALTSQFQRSSFERPLIMD